MSERLTYASVGDYYSSADETEHNALESYKDDSWGEVLDTIAENDDNDIILIVGHAVLLPLMGYGATDSDDFFPIQLGEGEGFILELDHRLKVIKHTFIKD